MKRAPQQEGSAAHGSHSLPMLVLHGGPGLDSSYLEQWVAPLSKWRKLVFYDQLGCGRDSTPPDKVSVDALVDQLSTLAKRYDNGDGVGFFAHSWGACLLYLALQNHRVRARELLLVSPVGLTRERFDRSGERLMERIPTDVMHKIGEHDAAGDGLGVMKTALPYYLGNRLNVPPIRFASYSSTAYARTLETLGQYDCRNIADQLPRRTMAIYGEKDIEVPDEILEIKPQVDVCMIPGAGHFGFAEAPNEFVRVTARFLES